MAIIKGKWMWNKTITWPSDMVEVPGVMESNIYFVSNDTDWIKIEAYQASLSITYRDSEGVPTTAYQNGVWVDQAYRIIDFGDGITLTDNAYKVITQNASQMTTIKGKWRWNDVLLTDPIDIVSKTQFISNNQTYVSVGVYMPQNDYDNGMLWYSGQDGNGGDVYTKMSGWENQGYKVMDFGYGADITIDVYNFISANATCIDYDTKMVSVNQLKTVYNKLNNKIAAGSGIPLLTTQTVNLADLEMGIYRWEYSVYNEEYECEETTKELICGGSSVELTHNPIFIQVHQDNSDKYFYLIDNAGMGYDECTRYIYWGGFNMEDNEGYIYSKDIFNIPDTYIDTTNIPTFSFDPATGILTITTNG